MAQNIGLFFHHAFQALLMQMKLHNVLNPVQHGIGLIINRNDVGSTKIEGAVQPLRIFILRKDDDRHAMQQFRIFLILKQHFVRLGHMCNIQQQRSYTGTVLLQQQHRLLNIDCLQQIEAFAHNMAQMGTIF